MMVGCSGFCAGLRPRTSKLDQSMNDTLFLLLAGLLAGSMNALAGGGSFVSLPALIGAGVPSVSANATSTVALFPGGLASTWVYRDGLTGVCGVPLVPVAIVTLVGGSSEVCCCCGRQPSCSIRFCRGCCSSPRSCWRLVGRSDLRCALAFGLAS